MRLLKDVKFSYLKQMKKAAIVGINGAGKSTLLKIIMGRRNVRCREVILAKDKAIG